jgi:hypothetical protein
MVNKASAIENPELQAEFLNLLASFMTNSSRNWNNENLSNQQLAEHLEVISQKKLKVDPEALEITLEQRSNSSNNSNNKKKFFKHAGNAGSNKFQNKNKKNNYYKK